MSTPRKRKQEKAKPDKANPDTSQLVEGGVYTPEQWARAKLYHAACEALRKLTPEEFVRAVAQTAYERRHPVDTEEITAAIAQLPYEHQDVAVPDGIYHALFLSLAGSLGLEIADAAKAKPERLAAIALGAQLHSGKRDTAMEVRRLATEIQEILATPASLRHQAERLIASVNNWRRGSAKRRVKEISVEAVEKALATNNLNGRVTSAAIAIGLFSLEDRQKALDAVRHALTKL